jgi:hypothetical protein
VTDVPSTLLVTKDVGPDADVAEVWLWAANGGGEEEAEGESSI